MARSFFIFATMKKGSGFEKFYSVKKGAAKKEQFKQEKRQFKKEREAKAEEKRKQLTVTTRPKIQRAVTDETMPLNKFIAHSGLCSRRDAAELVKAGKVKVNGELILEPGHKVSQKDVITASGKKIQRATNLVYILLNKPKDYITTTDDPQKKKDSP